MIKLHAAYTTHSQLGLILTPVADCDLESYLETFSICNAKNEIQKIQAMTTILEMAFGCLAFGLAFLRER